MKILEIVWQSLCGNQYYDDFFEIVTMYSDTNRFYHNLEHINNMLKLLQETVFLNPDKLKDIKALEAAIL